MFPRTLKTNIIISMVILLLIGMLLIDFVMVRTTQREMIQDKISKGYFVASVLRDAISMNFSNDIRELSKRLQPTFADILSESDFSSIYLMGAGNRVIYSAGKEIGLNAGMEKLMRETLASEKRIAKLFDTTWGVFWYQRKHLMVSIPIRNDDITIASIGILMNLETIYAKQRKSQRFVFFYLVINTLILTVIGFYRLSKVYLEPINRLVGTAMEYQGADGDFFPVRKHDNELSKLSKALNLMIHRISEDKKALQSAVDSLEKTNLELKKAQGEIIRAEKFASIGRLSSGIAHEIGNPIGIVTGYLDLLRQEDIPDYEKKEFILRITKEIHRMDMVIRQLLDLSRSSSVETKIVSVHEIIDDISKVLGVQPLMSKIHLSWSLKAEKDMVLVDPNQLRQVFINLAINAADAITAKGDPEHGRLIIESMNDPVATMENPSDGHTVTIMFSDNGLGISSAHLGSIFDPFFTTKEPGKGTGLGLSVCFMIIESMGGSICAESKEGEGTTMTIRLPLAR
jgi:signal transduction histidine kinase